MVFNEFLVPYRDFVGVFMASLMSELVDLDSTELDKLIHNFGKKKLVLNLRIRLCCEGYSFV